LNKSIRSIGKIIWENEEKILRGKSTKFETQVRGTIKLLSGYSKMVSGIDFTTCWKTKFEIKSTRSETEIRWQEALQLLFLLFEIDPLRRHSRLI
jgi:hypothetical protein